VNFIVDLIAFLDLLVLAGTGVILKWVLPPGSGGGHSHGQGFRGGRGPVEVKTLLGLGRHDWGDIHFHVSLLFVLLMLIHLILHWNWIKTYLKSLLFASTRAPGPSSDEPQAG
jgi:hypothetical protein